MSDDNPRIFKDMSSMCRLDLIEEYHHFLPYVKHVTNVRIDFDRERFTRSFWHDDLKERTYDIITFDHIDDLIERLTHRHLFVDLGLVVLVVV